MRTSVSGREFGLAVSRTGGRAHGAGRHNRRRSDSGVANRKTKKTGPASVRPVTHSRSGNPAKRPVEQQRPVTLGDWIGAARPRTLSLAIAPVLVGTGAARLGDPQFHWVIALACLAVAVCLQIGVNFANDYSDGVRGLSLIHI